MMKKQEFVPRKISEKPLYELKSVEDIPVSELYQVKINGKEQRVYHTEFFDFVSFLDENATYVFESGKAYNVGCLQLNSDETVYIEYGAVVSGRIYSRMADRVRILGNGILYGGNWHAWDENGAGDSTGSDLQNSVCTTVQQKIWKYRNLDGMAIWLDRCHSADVDFL